MNKAKLVASLVLVASIPAAIFAAGNAVGVSDQRLFAADDRKRTALVARSCGKTGRLLQDPFTNAYLCAWTNPDGATLTAEVPQHPYLDQLATR